MFSTPTKGGEAYLTDALADSRLIKVPYGKLKNYLADVGGDEIDAKELFTASTKFALVNIAEKHRISLDQLLDEVGPFTPSAPIGWNVRPIARGTSPKRARVPKSKPEQRSGSPTKKSIFALITDTASSILSITAPKAGAGQTPETPFAGAPSGSKSKTVLVRPVAVQFSEDTELEKRRQAFAAQSIQGTYKYNQMKRQRTTARSAALEEEKRKAAALAEPLSYADMKRQAASKVNAAQQDMGKKLQYEASLQEQRAASVLTGGASKYIQHKRAAKAEDERKSKAAGTIGQGASGYVQRRREAREREAAKANALASERTAAATGTIGKGAASYVARKREAKQKERQSAASAVISSRAKSHQERKREKWKQELEEQKRREAAKVLTNRGHKHMEDKRQKEAKAEKRQKELAIRRTAIQQEQAASKIGVISRKRAEARWNAWNELYGPDAKAPPPPEADSPLPKGWKQATHPDGRTYYFHKKTKKTQWTRPPPPEPPPPPPPDRSPCSQRFRCLQSMCQAMQQRRRSRRRS